MTVSEYIDGNEVVIIYYHLSFESLNYYDTPSSLLVHMKRISFNSQKIKTINEKRDFIINFYGGGWKCFENLCDEAKHSAKIIADKMYYSVK